MIKAIAKLLSLCLSIVVFFLVFRLSLGVSSWIIAGYVSKLEDISMPEAFPLYQMSIPSAAVAFLASSTLGSIINKYIDRTDDSTAKSLGILMLFTAIVLGPAIAAVFKF